MTVRTFTTTINVCDRCGSEHNAGDYSKSNQWGQLILKWRGDRGSRTYAGDAAGANLMGDAWLCMVCTDAFLKFMAERPATQEGGDK